MRSGSFEQGLSERKNLQKTLQNQLKKLGGLSERIENSVGVGTPDLNCIYKTVEFWIETKIVRKGKIGLDADQTAWHIRRTIQGGRVFVVARGVSAEGEDRVELLSWAKRSNGTWGLSLIFVGTPPRVDWEMLFRLCVSHPVGMIQA